MLRRSWIWHTCCAAASSMFVNCRSGICYAETTVWHGNAVSVRQTCCGTCQVRHRIIQKISTALLSLTALLSATMSKRAHGDNPEDSCTDLVVHSPNATLVDVQSTTYCYPPAASADDPVWAFLCELGPKHSKRAEGYTHQCAADNSKGSTCNCYLKLDLKAKAKLAFGARSKYKAWRGTQHMRQKVHENTAARRAVGSAKSIDMSTPPQHTVTSMVKQLLTPGSKDYQKTTQLRWYVYSKMVVSKAAFEDPFFVDMLNAQNPQAHVVGYKEISVFLEGEFRNFLVFIRHAIESSYQRVKGNKNTQEQHDATTFAINHRKFQSFAKSFIFEYTAWTVCFALRRCKDSSAAAVAEQYRNAHFEVVLREVSELAMGSIQDLAAMSTGEELLLHSDYDDGNDGCGMHQADKVLGWCTGALVKKKNKVVQDGFDEAVALMSKHHRRATEFSYGEARRDDLEDCLQQQGLAIVMPKLDKNKTSDDDESGPTVWKGRSSAAYRAESKKAVKEWRKLKVGSPLRSRSADTHSLARSCCARSTGSGISRRSWREWTRRTCTPWSICPRLTSGPS